MSQDLQLSQRTRQIVQYYFDNPNTPQKDLAVKFGLSQSRINQILNSERVIKAYPILARRRLGSMVPAAMKRYNELMEQGANLQVAEKVTSRVLDSQKVLNPVEIHIEHSLSDKTIDELHLIINQSKQIAGEVIEAEVVSESTEPAIHLNSPQIETI